MATLPSRSQKSRAVHEGPFVIVKYTEEGPKPGVIYKAPYILLRV